jgi:hypothetical protein
MCNASMYLIAYNMWVKISQLDALTFIYELHDGFVKPTVASAPRFDRCTSRFRMSLHLMRWNRRQRVLLVEMVAWYQFQ